MGLLGVIVGGVMTGYFSYKTQILSLDAHDREFKVNYQIEKNKTLRNDIQNYITNLSSLITVKDFDSTGRDSLLRNMNIISLKIALLQDYSIGSKSSHLTTVISDALQKKNLNDTTFNNAITEWMIAIKSEMKLNDYTVDNDVLEKDLLQFIINFDSKK